MITDTLILLEILSFLSFGSVWTPWCNDWLWPKAIRWRTSHILKEYKASLCLTNPYKHVRSLILKLSRNAYSVSFLSVLAKMLNPDLKNIPMPVLSYSTLLYCFPPSTLKIHSHTPSPGSCQCILHRNRSPSVNSLFPLRAETEFLWWNYNETLPWLLVWRQWEVKEADPDENKLNPAKHQPQVNCLHGTAVL